MKEPQGPIGRGFRMGRLGLRVVGSYIGYQFQNLFLDDDARAQCRKDLNRNVSRRVREELESLKGPMMKIGQILSMQTQSLPDEAIEELARLQMRAPGMHATLARAQFKSSIGKYPEDLFREFDPEPFAAASLGQVHRALTKSGQKVAVKIQYPAIRTAIENDFQLLRSVTLPGHVSGHFPDSILKEVRRGFLEETDYLHEGKNIDFFHENLACFPHITVPIVHWDTTTDRVLTMSFVEGLTIRDFLNRRPSQEIRNLIGFRLLEAYQYQVHSLRAIHADPHPGNYLFQDDGRIGLVDFGCVKRYSADIPELARLFLLRAWTKNDKHLRRMQQLIFGGAQFASNPKARQCMRSLIKFYEMIYPPPESGKTIVDFGDPAPLNSLAQNMRDAVRKKLTNPEVAFGSRTELGLYNLLHQLRAKVDTLEISRRTLARAEVPPSREP